MNQSKSLQLYSKHHISPTSSNYYLFGALRHSLSRKTFWNTAVICKDVNIFLLTKSLGNIIIDITDVTKLVEKWEQVVKRNRDWHLHRNRRYRVKTMNENSTFPKRHEFSRQLNTKDINIKLNQNEFHYKYILCIHKSIYTYITFLYLSIDAKRLAVFRSNDWHLPRLWIFWRNKFSDRYT